MTLKKYVHFGPNKVYLLEHCLVHVGPYVWFEPCNLHLFIQRYEFLRIILSITAWLKDVAINYASYATIYATGRHSFKMS